MTPRPISHEDLEQVLVATAPLWDEMRGQRLFITGGTGFFGCWLLETFCHINRSLNLDAQVTVLTRSPEAFRAKLPHVTSDAAVTLLAGDVRSFDFPSGDFRYVIHAATQASAKQAAEAPQEMLSTILAGTERTIAFATSHGARRLLLTSSGAVYGRQPAEITHLPESYAGAPDPLDPASVYAEGKRASELMCAIACRTSGLECAIARCWAFCGPHLPLDAHFAIGNFIGDVLAERSIQIAGDGTPRRSYLYGSDLATWLWTMLFKAPSLLAINVGSDDDVSILELAQSVAATLDPGSNVTIGQRPSSGAKPTRYVPDVERARELLGLKQAVGLQEMIRRTADWYRRAPEER